MKNVKDSWYTGEDTPRQTPRGKSREKKDRDSRISCWETNIEKCRDDCEEKRSSGEITQKKVFLGEEELKMAVILNGRVLKQRGTPAHKFEPAE